VMATSAAATLAYVDETSREKEGRLAG
jgi:hypothetical protein